MGLHKHVLYEMQMKNVLPPWNHAELILQQSDPHYQTDWPTDHVLQKATDFILY